MRSRIAPSRALLAALLVAVLGDLAGLAPPAGAAVGLVQLPGREGDGPVTVYYPSSGEERPVTRGPFTLQLAEGSDPVRGNGRLIVISHGSGGSPWVHADLARALVAAGFVVAMPEHRGDNFRDSSTPGPESWKRRPGEVSRAIDAVAADPRFAPLLSFDRVGVYGMSAGGHTVLTLAGGRWTRDRIAQHCDRHIDEDFHTCVGLDTRLTGGVLDGVKKTIARWVIDARLSGDVEPNGYTDPRIAAAVAGVPFAVDFDPASLASPGIPLGLVTARRDVWLVPRFNSDVILAACTGCEHVADFSTGGHGALLSPPPPGLTGLVGDLLADPPDFDRAKEVPAVNAKIVDFFRRNLPPPPPSEE